MLIDPSLRARRPRRRDRRDDEAAASRRRASSPDRIRVIPNWVDTGERRAAAARQRVGAPAQAGEAASSSCTRATSATRRTSTRCPRDDVPARPRRPRRRRSIGSGARRGELVALTRTPRGGQGRVPRATRTARSSPQSLSTADVHVVGLARGLAGYVVPSRRLRDPRRRPAGDRRGRRRERDGAARHRGRLRRRRAAGRPVRARAPRSGTRTTASTTSRRWAAAAREFAERGGRPLDRDAALPGGHRRARGGRCSRLRSCSGRRWPRSSGRTSATRSQLRRLAACAAARASAPATSLPSVTLIVAAHDEEAVIERRLENLLALDYPAEQLEIVVASDASGDRTDELVEAVAAREPRVRLLRCPRGGKVAAQNRAVRESSTPRSSPSRDANAMWAPDALRLLVRSFADPRRRLRLRAARPDRTPPGTNREGVYWRFETWLREQESALGSVTGGNGAIYAVRRVRLRRGRPALRPRPLVAVPDGAARPARGLRRRGDRVREADAGDRGPSTGARCACSSTAG